MLYKAVQKDRNPEAIRWAIEQRHLGEAQYKVLIAVERMADQNAIAQILAVQLSDWVGIAQPGSTSRTNPGEDMTFGSIDDVRAAGFGDSVGFKKCGTKNPPMWSEHRRNSWSEAKKDCAPGGTRTRFEHFA